MPCCQHELATQISSDRFSAFTRYGIVKEHMAALLTDTIRANMLTPSGYETQFFEFVDLSHTPKNLLVRAVKASSSAKASETALQQIKALREEFHVNPTLCCLLEKLKT